MKLLVANTSFKLCLKRKPKQIKLNRKNEKKENLKSKKIADEEFQKSIKTLEYRNQETGIKRKLTNAERQKEFEQKQVNDGLKKISFWLSDEIIQVIENEQINHLKQHKVRLNKSKIITNLLRRPSAPERAS